MKAIPCILSINIYICHMFEIFTTLLFYTVKSIVLYCLPSVPCHITPNALYLWEKCNRELLLYIFKTWCIFLYVRFWYLLSFGNIFAHINKLPKTHSLQKIFPLNVADITEIPLLSFLVRLSVSHVLCLRRFVTSVSLCGHNVPSVYMNPAHKSFIGQSALITPSRSLLMYLGGLQRAAEYQISLHCGLC